MVFDSSLVFAQTQRTLISANGYIWQSIEDLRSDGHTDARKLCCGFINEYGWITQGKSFLWRFRIFEVMNKQIAGNGNTGSSIRLNHPRSLRFFEGSGFSFNLKKVFGVFCLRTHYWRRIVFLFFQKWSPQKKAKNWINGPVFYSANDCDNKRRNVVSWLSKDEV